MLLKDSAVFRSVLSQGRWSWPGCYPLFFVTSDGGTLCFDCAKKERAQISLAMRTKDKSEWRIEAVEVNYEDSHLMCDACSNHIESAYGQENEENTQ